MLFKIEFILNGNKVSIQTEGNKRLLDLLREDFHLAGTKEGCSIGECGACTVIVNNKAVNSCLMFAGQVDGAEVLTIEGLAVDVNADGALLVQNSSGAIHTIWAGDVQLI